MDLQNNTIYYKYEIQVRFSNVCFTEPTITENDGSSCAMTPEQARLRNFTYSSPLYFDVHVKSIEKSGDNFENINLFSKTNNSNKNYCPIITGVNFFDQSSNISELIQLEINNLAFPLLFVPFVSRASEILGKRIFLKIDNKEFLFNFNQSIYSNYLSGDIVEKSEKINLQFIENKNTFSEKEWSELYKISVNTFVEETDESKQKAAGAGLTDND